MIGFERVTVRRDGNVILRDVDLGVGEGETVVLLGRSGAGKSTMLRLVNRLVDPSSGTVRVRGRSTLEWDPLSLRRSVGYMIQEVGLLPHLSVGANVETVPRLLGWDRERRARRAAELLGLVGLDPEAVADRLPRRLSGGQRQRVGVARALAADPPILLCDEPFGALDPVTRRELQQWFKTLTRGLAKTLLFVTHDVREAMMLAHRIAFVAEGRLIACGTPDELRQSRRSEVQEFLAGT